ncbi:fungal-specific transcription factor domain-containing protein [Microdochium trichocladiopsis]|uniref:Fungal-specific transcription factor domain-containing protein n=1 Tax=Microdochium trichocladiopsis TaxID=1682393 RepID=A0A9P9BR43_9PEZI|nr:fungal-specific transcription factor domain-containing protein [Microdochium trichocladiopsis]KAH7026532.1 fungal-specific transcription factor domain-containing protein [Microdochium trichocladiopsis]
MPRPRKADAPEPKRRSRHGCWPCKNRKIKCGEERPNCTNCEKAGEECDYSIRLNWDGRRGKGNEGLIQFSPPTEAPTASSVPAKGFKLVHTFPTADAPATRRVEPLSAPSSSAKQSTADAAPVASGTPDLKQTPTKNDTDIFQRPAKRVKITAAGQTAVVSKRRERAASSSTIDSSTTLSKVNEAIEAPLWAGTSPSTPLTPSTTNEDLPQAEYGIPVAASPSLPRFSLNALLAGSPARSQVQEGSQSPSSARLPPLHSQSHQTYYGLDRGFVDRDIGRNDDQNAISGHSPLSQRDALDTPSEFEHDLFPNEFGFGMQQNSPTNEANNYYSAPVPIYIARELEPLPQRLLENPMNLLYFHHFLTHTARVLVPFDDKHANPFRTILPQIAVKNDSLLALLLAYSACHRARILNQPEPTLRISLWLEDVFPELRKALEDKDRNFSNANLATAIMIASLEIISPTVFGHHISWQKHLSLARELITSRPTGLHGGQTNFRDDQVSSFLWSWAAFLDVLGSLSGGRGNTSSSQTQWIFDYELDDIVDGYDEIDCVMGFTTRCIYLLAKIASLASRCDAERIGDDHEVRADWRPSEEIVSQAADLREGLLNSLRCPPVPCKHIHNHGDVAKWDRKSLTATNEATHWAAMVHLYRRILGRAAEDDSDVQYAVRKIFACLDLIEVGSAAESGLLLPMFTAGCEARSEADRSQILDRFLVAEKVGIVKVCEVTDCLA